MEWRQESGMEGEGEVGSAGLTMFATGQSNVFCITDQTRSMEYRLGTNVVTRLGANTPSINNKKT